MNDSSLLSTQEHIIRTTLAAVFCFVTFASASAQDISVPACDELFKRIEECGKNDDPAAGETGAESAANYRQSMIEQRNAGMDDGALAQACEALKISEDENMKAKGCE